MPGLIDAHWHAMLASMPIAAMRTADIGYLNLVAGEQATRTLHRGFTTVRDAGGPSFGLKRAFDDGTVAGPRIYPSGAFISQTSGHGRPAGYSIDVRVSAYVSADRLRINPSAVLAAEK